LGLLTTKALNESCGSYKYSLPHPQCFGQVAGLMRTKFWQNFGSFCFWGIRAGGIFFEIS